MIGELQLGFFRTSRVRLVRQTEVAECGFACLAMVAGYHGLDIDLGAIRRLYQPSLRGSGLKALIAVADRMGFSARPVKLPLEDLRNLQVPAVLHWDMNHFVVLERVAGDKALIHNPDGRSTWLPSAEVSKHFTGVALELRPADSFERGDQRERLKMSQLWRRMTGLKRALVQVLVLSAVMQAFVLASPYYMQVALDQALPALDGDLMTTLAVGFALFTLINAGAALLRSFVLLSAGASLSFGVASNIARRLFRLPVSWFEKRHVGDVLSRFQSIGPIQRALTEGAVGAVVDGVLALFTLALMMFYSVKLALIALVAFGLYALARWISFGFQREAQEATIVDAAKEQSAMIESIRGIVTLRLFNREAMRLAFWQGKLVDSTNASLQLSRITIWQQIANTVIFGLEAIVTIWLAVRATIDGGFSVGMVFAYIAYKGQFLQKAASLVDQSVAFRMLGLHLERLSDVALSEEDVSFGESASAQTELVGRIELKNVVYRYNPADPVVLKGLDLVVEPGDHIAITGPSGGGKSTLVKLLLGLVEPDGGEFLIDGLPLSRFGHKSYHEQIGAVLQNDSLFAGSLADNIALFDDSPDLQRIMQAAMIASIHNDIIAMPMAYETLVGDMGSTLSGGQKQRVLLARALYKQPKLLIIDEGTSHLDAAHEAAVNAAIAQIGVTRVVIAHRKETIASARKVFELINGKLQEVVDLSRVAYSNTDTGELAPVK